jgi:hypothetical protein
MILAEKWSVNVPLIGMITRLQTVTGCRALWKDRSLTLRKPQNTSLIRATAFNKTNVMQFFDNYERALKSWLFTAVRMYNIYETIVQSPNIAA